VEVARAFSYTQKKHESAEVVPAKEVVSEALCALEEKLLGAREGGKRVRETPLKAGDGWQGSLCS